MVMPRPAGVMVVSVWFIFVGVVIGFLAVVLLTGSFGLVQRGGTTGIFANGFVGGVGIFLAAVILPVALGVVALGWGSGACANGADCRPRFDRPKRRF